MPAPTPGNLEIAIEDDVKRISSNALFQNQLSGSGEIRLGHQLQLLQILLREVGEERHAAYLVERHRTLLRHPDEVLVNKLHDH